MRWTCGIDARNELVAHIAGREINCTPSGFDVYRRTLATCYLAGEDLNGWMVQEGWALAYVKYSSAYRQVEEDARANQRGLWQGAFIAPWDWRHRNNKTVILGAFSVPIDAQAMLLGSSATKGAPSPECTIKGIISRNGERIYHTEHCDSFQIALLGQANPRISAIGNRSEPRAVGRKIGVSSGSSLALKVCTGAAGGEFL